MVSSRACPRVSGVLRYKDFCLSQQFTGNQNLLPQLVLRTTPSIRVSTSIIAQGEPGGPSETASDDTAWSAVYGHGTDVLFLAGKSMYNVYLITDTVHNVTARMDDLFRMGVR